MTVSGVDEGVSLVGKYCGSGGYSGEEGFHPVQRVVEGNQDYGLLDTQLSVALEHGRRVAPAHLLQVVETSRAPPPISPGGKGGFMASIGQTWT